MKILFWFGRAQTAGVSISIDWLIDNPWPRPSLDQNQLTTRPRPGQYWVKGRDVAGMLYFFYVYDNNQDHNLNHDHDEKNDDNDDNDHDRDYDLVKQVEDLGCSLIYELLYHDHDHDLV